MTHLFDTIISNHKNKYVQRNETESCSHTVWYKSKDYLVQFPQQVDLFASEGEQRKVTWV